MGSLRISQFHVCRLLFLNHDCILSFDYSFIVWLLFITLIVLFLCILLLDHTYTHTLVHNKADEGFSDRILSVVLPPYAEPISILYTGQLVYWLVLSCFRTTHPEYKQNKEPVQPPCNTLSGIPKIKKWHLSPDWQWAGVNLCNDCISSQQPWCSFCSDCCLLESMKLMQLWM